MQWVIWATVSTLLLHSDYFIFKSSYQWGMEAYKLWIMGSISIFARHKCSLLGTLVFSQSKGMCVVSKCIHPHWGCECVWLCPALGLPPVQGVLVPCPCALGWTSGSLQSCIGKVVQRMVGSLDVHSSVSLTCNISIHCVVSKPEVWLAKKNSLRHYKEETVRGTIIYLWTPDHIIHMCFLNIPFLI